MTFTTIAYKSEHYWQMMALRHKMLREPIGLTFSGEDIESEKDDIFCACFEAEKIIGCCILTHGNDSTVKLRQMAVSDEYQNKGIGSDLIRFAEQEVLEYGYKSVLLHARKTAVGFYLKHGYYIVDNEFTEVGIAHYKMQKHLTRIG